MQIDMHYYATYAMAIQAGLPNDVAGTIAYAAQYVDDSTANNSKHHKDRGQLFSIATAHHPVQSGIDYYKNMFQPTTGDPVENATREQRKIWIPFHFFPGGKGEHLEEKLLCVKDGKIINQLLERYLQNAGSQKFANELIGIFAHVYMDTFSHYGFSGFSSSYNVVVNTEPMEENKGTLSYIKSKYEAFKGWFASDVSDGLGHAGGATFPDRPYLMWNVEFENQCPQIRSSTQRKNVDDYLEACEKLHNFFSRYANMYYKESATKTQKLFSEIKDEVAEILAFPGPKDQRVEKWVASSLCPGVKRYNTEDWEMMKQNFFENLPNSADIIDTPIYRFHQAATHHRYYVLKELLPENGIAVY